MHILRAMFARLTVLLAVLGGTGCMETEAPTMASRPARANVQSTTEPVPTKSPSTTCWGDVEALWKEGALLGESFDAQATSSEFAKGTKGGAVVPVAGGDEVKMHEDATWFAGVKLRTNPYEGKSEWIDTALKEVNDAKNKKEVLKAKAEVAISTCEPLRKVWNSHDQDVLTETDWNGFTQLAMTAGSACGCKGFDPVAFGALAALRWQHVTLELGAKKTQGECANKTIAACVGEAVAKP